MPDPVFLGELDVAARAGDLERLQGRDDGLAVGRAGVLDRGQQREHGVVALQREVVRLAVELADVALLDLLAELGQLDARAVGAGHQHVLAGVLHRVPEHLVVLRGAGAVEIERLRARREADLVGLLEDEEPPRLGHRDDQDLRLHLGLVLEQDRHEVLGGLLDHLVAELDVRAQLLDRALEVGRDADAVVRILDQARRLLDAVGHHHRDHVLGELRGVHAGAEDFVIARGGQGIRPARADDEGDAVLVEDLDLRRAYRGVVLAGRGHHLVRGDQLLDHGGAGGRPALGVLHDQLDLLAEHAAGGVDVVHRPLEPQHQLRTLLVASRRGQRRHAADLDGVVVCTGGDGRQ